MTRNQPTPPGSALNPDAASTGDGLLDYLSTAVLVLVGHEIKNPLGGLRGAAQLLECELPDAALREYTGVIIREADRLTALVDRMVGPRRPPRMEPVNIHEVTERVRALVNAETPASIVVERDYDPSIPALPADPELLIQAMLNIARNAVHALGDGGRIVLRTRVQRRVSIGVRQHRLMCRIDVADDGPGIPDDLVDRMFYPLVSGRDGGAGLGPKALKPDVVRYLESLDWPGNVRQLENACRWLTVMASGNEIHLDDLPPELRGAGGEVGDIMDDWEASLRRWAERRLGSGDGELLEDAMPKFETVLIKCALGRTGGGRQEAARLLGWGRNTLTRKIKELALDV